MRKCDITLPLVLKTTSNTCGHWRSKARVAKVQRGIAKAAVNNAGIVRGPMEHIRVTLTRLGPRTLDPINIESAFKHVCDGIADAIGLNDRSPLYHWEFRQEKSPHYLCRIQIEVLSEQAE